VDDGSTDGSRELAEKLAGEDERIHVILQAENRGIVEAMNAGLAACHGQVVARLDADDVMKPDRLKLQVAHLQNNPTCLAVGSAAEAFDAAGNMTLLTQPTNHSAIAKQLRTSSALFHPTVMYRREAVLQAGSYRKFFLDAEDYDLWLRLSRVGQLANLREPLSRLRVHEGQVSHRKVVQQVISALAAQQVHEAAASRRAIDLPEGKVASREWLVEQGMAGHVIDAAIAAGFAGRVGHLLHLGLIEQARALEEQGWETIGRAGAVGRQYQARLDWAWGRHGLRHGSVGGAMRMVRALMRDPGRARSALSKFLDRGKD
jgi:hypothetical protein